MTKQVEDTGAARAKAREAEKQAANATFYAAVSEGAPSRQRRRWLFRKASAQ